MLNLTDSIQNKNFIMLITSIVFMLGILTYFSFHEIVCALLFSVILICLCLYKIISPKKIFILIAIFYFAYFLTSIKIKNSDDLVILTPVNTTFKGQIISVPIKSQEGKIKFFIKINKAGNSVVKGKSFVSVMPDSTNINNLRIGDNVEIKGNLRKPYRATNPSQFDYSAYLKNFNAYTVIYSNSSDLKILKENNSIKWRFLRFLNNKRIEILDIHSKYLQSPNLEILGGIIFGDDAVSPPDNIKKSFINSGLLHILAASGMNVAFIYAFWFLILKFFRINFKFSVISGMFMVILYTLMTGLGPSVVRAALMLLFVLAGKLIDRDAHSISLLSLVAVLMLLYNPAYINDVSFQLSFLVTLGLLTTASIISEKLPKIPNWIKAPILIPIVAQIWVVPIQMFYFNTVSLYSIFANILTVTVLSVISFCGFVSSVLAMFKPIADFCCRGFDFYVDYLIRFVVFISDYIGNLPHCIIQTSHPEIYQIILYYVMIVSATYLIKYNRFKQACLTVMLILFVLCLTSFRIEQKDLQIITFDVGNADSFLIKTPQGKYFFIDTGKNPYKSGNSQANIIMLKYLKDRGIKHINGIIVTHFDSDHSGGTSDMIRNLKVDTLYLNTLKTSTVTGKNIFLTAKENNQKFVLAQNNKIIYQEPNLKLKTFKADIDGENGTNESSVITLLSYKNFDMIFMGDAGVEAFKQVKNEIPHDIEVLKVGHHGGSNVVDKEMINHLGNEVSVISTGTNYFGHPNKGTLDILRNTDIYRTDFNNSIKIVSDGEEYKVLNFDSHDKKYKLNKIFQTK